MVGAVSCRAAITPVAALLHLRRPPEGVASRSRGYGDFGKPHSGRNGRAESLLIQPLPYPRLPPLGEAVADRARLEAGRARMLTGRPEPAGG